MKRAPRAIALGLVGALLAASVVAAQEDGGGPTPEAPADAPPEVEPAPPELPGQLVGIYGSAHQAMASLRAAEGAPQMPEAPVEPTAFEASVAALTDDELAMLHAATQQVEAWSTLPDVYGDLASETSGSVTAAIEPPPPAPVPGMPVEPVEEDLLACPPPPPGTNFGNDAIFSAAVATTAIKAVAGAIPNPIHVGVDTVQIPNPVLGVVLAIVEVTEMVNHTLGWLKDRYFYCEGENQYLRNENADLIGAELWALLQVAEGTVHNLNDGVIELSDQVRAVQASADELLLTDIQQALIAPVGSPPNVAYELPAAHGGYLDATPIGVQGIVTDALAAAQRAGLPVNAAAPTYLAQADSLLAQARFVPAFQMYQRAYQGLLG